ncbi:MAG TPA: tetratricopeptide repeat protein, partial [Verrucomicrobiae bacterium]|nr:tetratricopeptide repeat protein [Verrucomicrobiae bacterium]
GLFINGKALLIDRTYRWFGVPHQEYRFYNDLEVVGIYLYQSSHIETVKIATKIIPDSAEARFNLAYRLAENGKLKEARAALAEGLKLDSQNWHGLMVLAFIEGQQDNWDGTVNHLEMVLQKNPDYNLARYFLGTAWYHHGSMNEARDEYRKYLQGETEPPYAEYAQKAIIQINEWTQGTNTESNAKANPSTPIKQ